jgi:hypothetical protein
MTNQTPNRNIALLADIEAFIASTGMAPSTLGRKAVNDGKAVSRLQQGKRMWPDTEDKLRSYMIAEHQRRAWP